MEFLIDECLSSELAKLAHARGYGESSHVFWSQVLEIAFDEDDEIHIFRYQLPPND